MLPSSIYDHLHFPPSPWRFKSVHSHSVQYFTACSLLSIFFLLLWIWLKQQIIIMLILTTITADHQYNTEIPSLVQNIVTANLKLYQNHQVHGHHHDADGLAGHKTWRTTQTTTRRYKCAIRESLHSSWYFNIFLTFYIWDRFCTPLVT
jgi:hypothetical protein